MRRTVLAAVVIATAASFSPAATACEEMPCRAIDGFCTEVRPSGYACSFSYRACALAGLCP